MMTPQKAGTNGVGIRVRFDIPGFVPGFFVDVNGVYWTVVDNKKTR